MRATRPFPFFQPIIFVLFGVVISVAVVVASSPTMPRHIRDFPRFAALNLKANWEIVQKTIKKVSRKPGEPLENSSITG